MISSLSIDYLIRIKNAYRAGRQKLSAPSSKLNVALSQILKKHGFIHDFKVSSQAKKTIQTSLSYDKNKLPAIENIKIFSKPGRRLYQKASSLPWGQTQRSLIIISTSQGLMSQKQAHLKNLGGEILAEIY